MRAVRPLDHDAATRRDPSLDASRRLSTRAGSTAAEAVARLRRRVGPEEPPGAKPMGCRWSWIAALVGFGAGLLLFGLARTTPVAVLVLQRIPGGYGEPVVEHYRVGVLSGDKPAAAYLPVRVGSPGP